MQKPSVVIDLGWEELLTTKELRSLANQILHLYGAQRRAAKPLDLHITNVVGRMKEALQAHNGFEKWDLQFHSEHFLELFLEKDIIYFSPDAEEVCKELEKDKVYIIGGIVDRDRLKGVTVDQATELGIKCVRLPINECGLIEEGNFPKKSLNVNHVYEILLGYSEFGNWKDALGPVLPTRKKFSYQKKSGEEEEPSPLKESGEEEPLKESGEEEE